MHFYFASRSPAWVLTLAVLLAAPSLAAAQPAPIVYAGQGNAAALGPSLAGGGEHSYGYGAQANRGAAPDAAIDIRRAGARSEQGATPWLERERVGPPYEINGRWYVPTPEPGYEQTGQASWYGPAFHGQATASGERFDQEALSAAHPTLPIPSLVQVTNLENGREIIVRINDRGPFVGERLIDLSRRSAEVLGFEQAGQARVHIRYLGPAPRRVNAEGDVAPDPAPAPAEGPLSLLPQAAEPDQAPLPVSPAGAGYYVQVGAFSDLANAHRVRAAVASAGPVLVDARQSEAGELFRVRLGPWASHAEAGAVQQRLAELGYGQAIIAAR